MRWNEMKVVPLQAANPGLRWQETTLEFDFDPVCEVVAHLGRREVYSKILPMTPPLHLATLQFLEPSCWVSCLPVSHAAAIATLVFLHD